MRDIACFAWWLGRCGGLVAGVLLCGAIAPTPVEAQPAADPTRHVIVASLANASKPRDLDYQAGECDIDASGKTMECVFQQVFLTVALFDAETCLITTNRFGLTFEKQGDNRWVSKEGPEGECGVMDVTTLENSGGARWTMEARKTVTKKDASADCRQTADSSETLSWQNVRRPLACKFVQPGAMSR
jgi:hypothetical protein